MENRAARRPDVPSVAVTELTRTFGPVTALSRLTVEMPQGVVGLVGANGAGKSTLIKTLVGELPLMAGERTVSDHTRIGYFAQHQVDHLDLKASPLLQLTRIAGRTDELTLRKFLGSFGFGGDRVDDTIENFSGGEKARLALALIVWQRPNVLLLDEPTNHLDLEMRHALTMAIQEYQGALVIVSHERHLLKACCDEFLLVADGKAQAFEGDLEDYADWLRQWRVAQEAAATKPAAKPAPQAAAAPVAESPRKGVAINKEAQKAFAKAEKQLAELQQKQQALENTLGDAAIYEPARKAELVQALAEKAAVEARLQSVEEEWLHWSSVLEAGG